MNGEHTGNAQTTRNLAILIFNDVEVLDFCGPFEVFAVTGRDADLRPFHVYTIAEQSGPILARNGLSINSRYTLADGPSPDILLVPGGLGTRREMHNADLIDWIRTTSANVELVLSVCTGALLLAQAIDLLKTIAPHTTVHANRRYVDNGKIILSAGISAGIDMSFHVVERLLGTEQALETARHMEYDWQHS
jgi:transcriptional regulator GlxA family with amidase domain